MRSVPPDKLYREVHYLIVWNMLKKEWVVKKIYLLTEKIPFLFFSPGFSYLSRIKTIHYLSHHQFSFCASIVPIPDQPCFEYVPAGHLQDV